MNQNIRFKGLVGSSYLLKNGNYDGERTINRFIEYNEAGLGKDAEPAQLAPTPGLTPLVTGLLPGYRGGWVSSTGRLFVVTGNTLYVVTGVDGSSTGWSVAVVGTVDGSGPVYLTDNGVTLFLVTSTGNVYGVDLTTLAFDNLTALNPGGGWLPASSCCYMDGYVLFSQLNANSIFWTDLFSTSVQGLNFASAETNPDHVVAVFTNNEDVWVFGQVVTELWYDLGGGNTVFTRRPGIVVETGAAAPATIQKLQNTLLWLSTDPRGGATVNMANGYSPVRVSTFPIEQLLNACSEAQLKLATADTYQLNGHAFYQLNAPGLTSTLVFDLTGYQQTGKPQWHERQSGLGVLAGRSIAQGHTYYKGKHVVGGYNDGNLYFYDDASNEENGQLVARIRITPHVSSALKRVKYISLQLDFTPGGPPDQTVEPQVLLQYSDDGGRTWSSERWASLGSKGQYGNRVIFYQLGVSRNRVFKITDINNGYSGLSGGELVLDLGAN
jgi:hypothetical protein